jgi:hypothetical protein
MARLILSFQIDKDITYLVIDKQIWPMGREVGEYGPDCSIRCLRPSVNNGTEKKEKVIG